MAIQFVQGDVSVAHAKIQQRLEQELRNEQRVLWVVPGGSNISLVVAIMKALPTELTKHLAIMLSDERFGVVNHPDSNLRQLHDQGFEAGQATVLPVLRPEVNLADTTSLYGQAAQAAFAAADVIIVHLGMGADGHIAGILPGSIATHPTNAWAVAYEAPPFTRITLTPFALREASRVFVVAFGDTKHEAITQLRQESLPLDRQPAQLLKELSDVMFITDQRGGEE